MGATLTSRTYPPPNGSRHSDPRAHTRPRADGPPERVAGTPSTAITRLSVLIATPSRPRVQHPGSHGLSPVRLAPLAPLRHYSRQQSFSIARSLARSLGLLGISGLPYRCWGQRDRRPVSPRMTDSMQRNAAALKTMPWQGRQTQCVNCDGPDRLRVRDTRTARMAMVASATSPDRARDRGCCFGASKTPSGSRSRALAGSRDGRRFVVAAVFLSARWCLSSSIGMGRIPD
jgi:hypothetical protein